MKLTDGKRIIEIKMKNRNYKTNNYGPDFSKEFFKAGSLEYSEKDQAYKVKDVEYCIEQVKDFREGAGEYRKYGEHENLNIFVTGLPVDIYGNTLMWFEIALDDYIYEENLAHEDEADKIYVTSDPYLSDGEWVVDAKTETFGDFGLTLLGDCNIYAF